MQPLDTQVLHQAIAQLEHEHRALGADIESMSVDKKCDQLELRRLKKRKLAIKDQLALLRSNLIPNLNA